MTILNPEDVEAVFIGLGLPFRFSEDEKKTLSTTSIVSEHTNLFGFPTPARNHGINIINLRELVGVEPQHQPSFFDHPWYLEEPFARVDCIPGWHFLEMEVGPETIEQPYHYFSSYESRGLTLPSAIEVVLMLFLHYVRSGENLLLKKHTWCRDQATLGRMVTVGAFGRNGVFISGHPPAFASRGLGICGKLMNPQCGETSR